mgnify:CR=1 FL=1
MKVLVIGDTCKDVYTYGHCKRMCPDAPIPVFVPTSNKINMGMAGNVYENLVSLGIDSDLKSNENTIVKTRYVEKTKNHMLLRIDSGEESIKRISDLEKEYLDEYEAIIVSDYDKGYLHEDDIEFICNNHPMVFVDTKKIIGNFCKNCKFIKINNNEYEKSFNMFNNPSYSWAKEKIIITLGSKGCSFRNKIYKVEEVMIKDTSGAGDTFMASFVCKYLQTRDVEKALVFANECSTIVVQKTGVNTVGEMK